MKTVQVFMSTFNGYENIKRQIKTILDQKKVKIILTIRDDGSDRKTINILKGIQNNLRNVKVIFGENIGYKKSFLTLLKYYNDKADYFAFSDQDDVWEKEKIYRAVEKLDSCADSQKLYISGLKLYDENMKYIKTKDISHVQNNIYSLFTRNRFAGCTFVFSKSLLKHVNKYCDTSYPNSEMPDHDFIFVSFAYAYGSVLLDSENYIKHIRYSNSVTAGGNGIWKRIKVEFINTFIVKGTKSNMACMLLKDKNHIKDEAMIDYLKKVAFYKKNLKYKIELIKYMRCGNIVCNLESIMKLFLSNF